MPESSDVSANEQATATQYNNLRKDVLDPSVGHDHSGEADHGAIISGGWKLLETLSPSTDTSISSSTLAAYDVFMVLIKLTGANAAESQFYMRLNGDTDNDYNSYYMDAAVPASLLAAASMRLCSFLNANPDMVGQITLPGKLGATEVPVTGNVAPSGAYNRFLWGWYVAAANITSFTFGATAGTITGKVAIYGMNFS